MVNAHHGSVHALVTLVLYLRLMCHCVCAAEAVLQAKQTARQMAKEAADAAAKAAADSCSVCGGEYKGEDKVGSYIFQHEAERKPILGVHNISHTVLQTASTCQKCRCQALVACFLH